MMKILKACYDWRVISVLAAVGIGILLLAPSLLSSALPLLFVAACPLSMMLMMKTMGGHEMNAADRAVSADPQARADQLLSELAASRREQDRIVRELEQVRGQADVSPASVKSSAPPA